MSLNISNHSVPKPDIRSKELVLTVGTLAAVGVVINLAAFAYVIYSPKIRRPLKVILFNLVGCDCIFLTSVFITGIVKLRPSDVTYVCPILTIMIMAPFLISYSAILGLAGYNFIAVFKAIHFSAYVTTSRAVIISAIAWSVIILTIILSVSLGGPADIYCSNMSQVPSFMLVLFAVYCILCSFGMVVLNIAVAAKLRSARSSSGGHNKNKVVPSMGAEDTFYRPDSFQLPQFLEVPKSSLHSDTRSSDIQNTATPPAALDASHLFSLNKNVSLEGHQLKTSSHTALQTSQSRLYTTISDSFNTSPPLDQEIQHETTKHRNDLGDNTTLEEPASDTGTYLQKTTGISSVPDIPVSIVSENSQTTTQVSVRSNEDLNSRVYFDPPSEHSLQTQPLTWRLHRKRILSSLAMTSTCTEKVCDDITNKPIIETCPNSRNTRQPLMPRMSSRMRTTIVTLTILAFWNAGMTLPTLGMWLWMATVKNVTTEVTYPWVITALSVLSMLNSVINPIIYAWRFVDWRKLCTWFCKHDSFTLPAGSKVMESRQNTVMSH